MFDIINVGRYLCSVSFPLFEGSLGMAFHCLQEMFALLLSCYGAKWFYRHQYGLFAGVASKSIVWFLLFLPS